MPRFWDFEFLTYGDFKIPIFRDSENLRFRFFEILRFCDSRFWDPEFLTFWDSDIPRFRDSVILRFWDLEISRFWVFDILRFRDSGMFYTDTWISIVNELILRPTWNASISAIALNCIRAAWDVQTEGDDETLLSLKIGRGVVCQIQTSSQSLFDFVQCLFNKLGPLPMEKRAWSNWRATSTTHL